jgi:hypothetical protein
MSRRSISGFDSAQSRSDRQNLVDQLFIDQRPVPQILLLLNLTFKDPSKNTLVSTPGMVRLVVDPSRLLGLPLSLPGESPELQSPAVSPGKERSRPSACRRLGKRATRRKPAIRTAALFCHVLIEPRAQTAQPYRCR